MKISFSLYTIFNITALLLWCILFAPILLPLSFRKSWHPLALKLHIWWARGVIFSMRIPLEIEWRFKPIRDQKYIFCANHFSYFDILSLLTVFPVKFIGKSSGSKIPIVGLIYKNIHVTVNRSDPADRSKSLSQAKEALDQGFNVAIFPEGGIRTTPEEIPQMHPFKEGAFLMSVDKKVPIVPVTLLTNYEILPDQIPIRFYHRPCKMVIHEPIWPDSHKKAAQLKAETFQVIQDELNNSIKTKVPEVD